MLSAVSGGDKAAFQGLYGAWRERLYLQVVRVLRDPAQSEEVVQDIFLELWTDPDRFHPGRGTAAGYLHRLARSRAIDRVRASQTHRDYLVRAGTFEYHAGTAALGRVHDDWATRYDLDKALDELTFLQRQALELAFFHDLTHVEISTQLGVPLGTVKSRITGALARLRTSRVWDTPVAA